ncbi:MAG: hypothetical protein LBG87_00310 [Spirochaetaceae bacterium]|jgi:hypothetical protein|nr:hypothetical protein [Spirochaetaceae bacterium]
MTLTDRRRTAILTHFRRILLAQQDRLKTFLEILKKQKTALEQGETETAVAYTEHEEYIFAEIKELQKTAGSWNALYLSVSAPNDGIRAIKTARDALLKEAEQGIAENRRLLSLRMASTASALQAVKQNPLRKRAQGYTGAIATGTINFTL